MSSIDNVKQIFLKYSLEDKIIFLDVLLKEITILGADKTFIGTISSIVHGISVNEEICITVFGMIDAVVQAYKQHIRDMKVSVYEVGMNKLMEIQEKEKKIKIKENVDNYLENALLNL